MLVMVLIDSRMMIGGRVMMLVMVLIDDRMMIDSRMMIVAI